MRLASVLAALSLLVLSAGSTIAAVSDDNPAAKKYISNLRVGGWIGNDALLVLPDRSAGAAPTGGGFGGVKLTEISDNSFTVEYKGTKGKGPLDPAWQLAPHPDLTNWLIGYMKGVSAKIDAQTPDVSQQGVIHLTHDGIVSSTFMKVQQANPFPSLPTWMESIDLKVTINPHQATQVALVSMMVTPQAYDRLQKPMYEVPKDETAKK